LGLGLQGLEGDHRSDGRVVAEPRVLADLVQLHTLLRVRLQKLGDQVLGYARKTTWPLDSLVQNVVEKFFLVFANKGWVACHELEEKNTEVPDV
jgi:hypothetical protein